MSKQPAQEAAPAPKIIDPVILLGDSPYRLKWDKAAAFRADEAGIYSGKSSGVGYARTAKYIWAMLPDNGRLAYPTPESMANDLPPLSEMREFVNAAIRLAGEGMDPKKVFG